MINRLDTKKLKFLSALLFISVSLAAGMAVVACQVSQTSAQDSAYCVESGYLYTTIPGVDSGRGICQFPDGTWCDAHAFSTGNCSPNPAIYPTIIAPGEYIVPSGNYNPYYYNPYYAYNPTFANDSQAALDIADATKSCQKMGGGVSSVHTPYGDVRLCVFPDGSSIDLSQLSGQFYGATPNLVYPNGSPAPVVTSTAPIGSVVYENGIPVENWYYYAYSWLNAP
jgi:putative hemolysin